VKVGDLVMRRLVGSSEVGIIVLTYEYTEEALVLWENDSTWVQKHSLEVISENR